MEYIEYYRIIRQRIWIAVMIAVLAGAVVLGMYLRPRAEKSYVGRMVIAVNDAAMRTVALQGDVLTIGSPADDKTFWGSFIELAQGRLLPEAIARAVPKVPEDDCSPLQLGRLEDTKLVSLEVTTRTKEQAEAVAFGCVGAMDRLWRSRQIESAEGISRQLAGRITELEKQIRYLADRTDQIITAYGGLDPASRADALEQELRALEQQLVSSQLEAVGVTQQARVLAAGSTAQVPVKAGLTPVVDTATDPRVAALQAKILDKGLEIDDALIRRTPDHPEVKALQAQLQTLEGRLRQVQREVSASVPAGSDNTIVDPGLRRDTLVAQAAAQAMNGRIVFISRRIAEIRNKLPALHTAGAAYDALAQPLQADRDTRATLLGHQIQVSSELNTLKMARAPEMVTAMTPQASVEGTRRPTRGFIMKFIVALIAGFGIGVLTILMMHYVDMSFRNEEEAEQMLGERVLVGIPRTDVVLREPATEAGQDADRTTPP
jgi:uncharacterized protein involved in exopolysaccharide biosynthesis